MPTNGDISVRASCQSSLCSVNGAGKSTMIKVLTGELEPTTEQYGNSQNSNRIYCSACFPSHESHLNKTQMSILDGALLLAMTEKDWIRLL